LTDLPAVQAIINALKRQLEAQPALESVNFFSVPNYEPPTFAGQPVCHIFSNGRDAEEFASAKRYASTLRIAILLMQPSPEQRNEDRAIHRWEEIIEDAIIADLQMRTAKTANLLPANVAVDELSVLGADYSKTTEGMLVVDELIMDVQCKYVRVVQ
jgi:hypothetical protein